MKNNSLDKYIKKAKLPKDEMINTSISLKRIQKDFIDKNNLNLSDMVRDMLDDLIKKQGKAS